MRRLSRFPFLVGIVASSVILLTSVFADLPANLVALIGMAWSTAYILLIIARLHDAEHSGWWWPLVLFTSLLRLIAVGAVEGTKGPNKYGEQPSGKLIDLLAFVRR